MSIAINIFALFFIATILAMFVQVNGHRLLVAVALCAFVCEATTYLIYIYIKTALTCPLFFINTPFLRILLCIARAINVVDALLFISLIFLFYRVVRKKETGA